MSRAASGEPSIQFDESKLTRPSAQIQRITADRREISRARPQKSTIDRDLLRKPDLRPKTLVDPKSLVTPPAKCTGTDGGDHIWGDGICQACGFNSNSWAHGPMQPQEEEIQQLQVPPEK